MNDFRPLGKPLPRELPEVEVESIVPSTTPGIYRVDGKLQTWIPENERANNPSIDFILEAMERLKDPEFPVFFWGTW